MVVESQIQTTVAQIVDQFSLELQKIKILLGSAEKGFSIQQVGLKKGQRGENLFRSLITVKSFIQLLLYLYCSNSLSLSKSVNAILFTFTSDNVELIHDLGVVAQKCLLERSLLQKCVPKSWITSEPKVEKDEELVDDQIIAEYGLEKEAFTTEKHASEWNARMVFHLLDQIPTEYLAVLAGVQRTISSRKVSEQVSKVKIKEIYNQISKVMLYFSQNTSIELNLLDPNYCKYLGNSVVFLRDLLFEEHRTTPSMLQTMQLSSYDDLGGIEELFRIHSILTLNDTNEETSKTIEILLVLFQDLSSDKKFHESIYTATLIGRQRQKTHPDYFDSLTMFIKLRTKIFQYLLQLWGSPKFLKLSKIAARAVILTLSQIYKAEGEEKAVTTVLHSLARVLPTPTVITPDPVKIDILCDMGFPRQAAEIALRRTGNSVSRAADYLLSHPSIVITAMEAPSADPTLTGTSASVTPGNAVPETGPSAGPSSAVTAAGPSTEITPVTTAAEVLAVASFPISSDIVAASTIQDEIMIESLPKVAQAEDHLKELNDLRKESMESVSIRIVDILPNLDTSLVLCIKNLLCVTAKDDISKYFEMICGTIKEKAEGLELFLRLVSVLIADLHYQPILLVKDIVPIDSLIDLLKSQEKGDEPTMSPVMLIMESLLSFDDEPKEAPLIIDAEGKLIETEEPPKSSLKLSLKNREIVLDQMIRFLNQDSIAPESIHSILRLIVRLTREFSLARIFFQSKGLEMLFKTTNLSRFPFQNSLMMMILRHSVETPEMVQEMMENELSHMLTHPRSKTLDCANFIKGTSHMICRDSGLFTKAVEKVCQLSRFNPKDRLHLISFKEDAKKESCKIESSGSVQLMDFFVRQILELRNSNLSVVDTHLYRCSLLQCVSELLVASPTCKVDLIQMSLKKPTKQTPRPTAKNPLLHYLLNEILPIELSEDEVKDEAHQYRTKESSWTIGLLSALCTKTSFVESPSAEDLKNHEFVCGVVLDCVLRCLKDCVSKQDVKIETRYGKLVSISELSKRLLSFPKSKEEQSESLGLAKVMIEKGFVSLFTTALADLDVQHPLSSKIIGSILKPLELLSKAAIQLGKSDMIKKKTDSFDKAFNQIEHEELTESNQEISNVFRNSALGILEPDSQVEASSESEDDEMDFGEFSDDDGESDESEEHSSDDEMEIIVPEPYHGAQEADMSHFEEDDSSDDESSGMEEGNVIDWENVSQEDIGLDHGDEFHEDEEEDEADEDDDEGHDHVHEHGAIEFNFGGEHMEMDTGSDEESEEFGQGVDLFTEDEDMMAMDQHNVAAIQQRMQNIISQGMRDASYDLPWMRNGGPGLLGAESTEEPLFGRPRAGLNRLTNEESTHPLLTGTVDPITIQRRHIINHDVLNEPSTATSIFQTIFGQATQGRNIFTRMITPVVEMDQTPEQKQVKNLHQVNLQFTDERWKQEARVLYGSSYNDVAKKLQNDILNQLIPSGMAENEERAEKAKKEQEDAEKRLKEAKEQLEESRKMLDDQMARNEENESEMAVDETNVVESTPEEPAPERQIVMVSGNPVDITGIIFLTKGLESISLSWKLYQMICDRMLSISTCVNNHQLSKKSEANPNYFQSFLTRYLKK
jgi:E3 ubiquitin-protein ligase HUWE1